METEWIWKQAEHIEYIISRHLLEGELFDSGVGHQVEEDF